MEPQDQNSELSNIQKVKIHFRENKKFYIGFGLGALVALALHQKPVQIINSVAPVFHNDNSSNVMMGGYLRKIVRNDSTGQISEKIGIAADRAGVPIDVMSKHLNAHPGYEDVKGETYSIIGVGN